MSDPTRPIQIGFYESDGAMHSLATSGQYAYLAVAPTYEDGRAQGGGLRVVDVGDWLSLNGLPVAPVAQHDGVWVLRAQPVILQQAVQDRPWAKSGQVVFAYGGQLAKQAGLLPREAVEPEHSRWPALP